MFGIDRVPDGIRDQVDVDRTMVTGDVLFAGSVGRTDLPGRRPGRDAAQPARRRAAAARHDARAARPLPGHDDGPRARHQPLPERLARVSTPARAAPGRQGHADQRLPRVPPVRAHRRAALPRRHPRDVRAARLLLRRDAVHRADRPAQRPGRGRRQGDLRRRRASPAAATRTPGWGLHFDMTVPFARYVLENAGKLAFPFRRYQIQKAWRGERPQEGRYREFTQADIDVVDVGQLSPHFEAEMPLVIADVFSRFPVGEFVIQVNDRKIPNGFYQGIGITDVIGTLRIVDKLDKIGPEKVKALLVESGTTRRAGRPVPRARRDPLDRPRLRRAGARARCRAPAARRGPRVPRERHPHRHGPRPGQARRRPAHRARPRLLHRHRLRDAVRRPRVVGLVLLGRALRRPRQRRHATPTPASASRSA